MISVDRSGAGIPADLQDVGPAVQSLRAILEERPLVDGDFNEQLYRAARESLWQLQHKKCAFCEHKAQRRFATVEHFRPKSIYWWLAYHYPNLWFCCPACNTLKRDLFPLVEGARRLQEEEKPDQVDEAALLLDPSVDDPERHLTFLRIPTGWQIAPLDDRGDATIRTYALDRDDLTELRNDYYDDELASVVDRGDGQRAGELSAPRKPWALFARVVFRSEGLLA